MDSLLWAIVFQVWQTVNPYQVSERDTLSNVTFIHYFEMNVRFVHQFWTGKILYSANHWGILTSKYNL